jgi:hypothetical protein
LKLKIRDCEIPERFLTYVVLSTGYFAVSFSGVAPREEATEMLRRLKLIAQESAIPYEAVDNNGIESTGICNLKNLNFGETPANRNMIKFSGRLVHPFI